MRVFLVPLCFRVPESSLGHGIVAALEKGVASEYASDGEDEANEKATFFERFESVG